MSNPKIYKYPNEISFWQKNGWEKERILETRELYEKGFLSLVSLCNLITLFISFAFGEPLTQLEHF